MASALLWYSRASDQGDASAQTKLATLLFKGKGTVADRKQACELWRKASEAGESIAAQNLQSLCSVTSAAN
jgi:TPR repeat protein